MKQKNKNEMEVMLKKNQFIDENIKVTDDKCKPSTKNTSHWQKVQVIDKKCKLSTQNRSHIKKNAIHRRKMYVCNR